MFAHPVKSESLSLRHSARLAPLHPQSARRAPFDEFFGSLIAHGVEYLIVGAYALAYHGAPRYTGDIDVFLRPTVGNAKRLLDALSAFGFSDTGLGPEDIVNPARVIQIGVEPVQIHVMSDISGVTWEEAWAARSSDDHRHGGWPGG